MAYAFDVRYIGYKLGIPTKKHHRFIVEKNRKLLAAQAAKRREGRDSTIILSIVARGEYPA